MRTKHLARWLRSFPDIMSHPNSAQQRALKILAKSVYRELKASGYVRSDMISFTTELLGLVTSEIKQDNESAAVVTT